MISRKYILISINDLDDSICSQVLKFADETLNCSANDIDNLHTDLRNLCNWSQNGHMFVFIVDKCKVMLIGHTYYKAKYETNGKF